MQWSNEAAKEGSSVRRRERERRRWPAFSVEQRIRVGFRVEWDEVVDLLAGADKTNRQAQFARDGHHNATFCRAVKLRQDDAADADRRGELAGLSEAVLPRRRV